MDLEKCPERLRGHTDEVLCLAVLESMEGACQLLASGGADGSVRLWDAVSGSPLAHIHRSALLAPLSAVAADAKAQQRKGSAEGGKEEEDAEEEEEAVTSLAFAPKAGMLYAGVGRFIAEIKVAVSSITETGKSTASTEKEGGESIESRTEEEAQADAAVSGASESLASSLVASGRRLTATLDARAVFNVCAEEVNSLSVHEKETYLAAGEDSGEVVVLDLGTRGVYKRLKRHHSNIVTSVAFRPRRPWEVVSGSMDSTSIHWDFSKSKPLEVWNFAQQAPSNMPAINPPMVFSLAMHADGRSLAVGLGDTTARVVRFGQKNARADISHTLQGHGLGISAIHFPAGRDTCLVTGGVDKKIMLWRLDLPDDKALSQTLVHTSKVNAIASTATHLFVADQSKGIALYRWK